MFYSKKIFWLWILTGLTITAWLLFVVSASEIGGSLNNGIDQWLSVSLPCSPVSVSNGSVNTTTCAITCNAGYDKSWTSCIVHQSNGGWGGGWAPVTPNCSLSNLVCIDGTYVKKNGVSCVWWELGNSCSVTTWSVSTGSLENTGSTIPPVGGDISWSPFSPELNNAYLYAYHLWITTMPTIEQANVTWTLIRSNMAKMIVNYAIKVLNKTPDTWAICSFNDIADQTVELQWYIKLSCQLGLMGINMQSFLPNQEVTRAEFGTTLSRLLYGNTYEWGTLYYTNHLLALQAAGIMNNITDPELMLEIRWYVMLMLMRADK